MTGEKRSPNSPKRIYLTPLREWAHRHGTLFRSQNYGTPPVDLSSNALVDLPEGEGSQWRRFSATRCAASASHLYGKPVTSSETWTWLHSPVFRATPLEMKAEADLHFLQGVNQLIGHGFPYSPPSAGEPGWRFYAAAVLNEHNPWWLVMPEVARYLQRLSFLLRQGKPANDVAVYCPRTMPGRASRRAMSRSTNPWTACLGRILCRTFWTPDITSISSTTAPSRMAVCHTPY
jgi:alpha-L-rhamnosidase